MESEAAVAPLGAELTERPFTAHTVDLVETPRLDIEVAELVAKSCDTAARAVDLQDDGVDSLEAASRESEVPVVSLGDELVARSITQTMDSVETAGPEPEVPLVPLAQEIAAPAEPLREEPAAVESPAAESRREEPEVPAAPVPEEPAAGAPVGYLSSSSVCCHWPVRSSACLASTSSSGGDLLRRRKYLATSSMALANCCRLTSNLASSRVGAFPS